MNGSSSTIHSIGRRASLLLSILAFGTLAALGSGCAKSLGSDASEPNKNAPLSADAMKKVSGLTDAQLITRAHEGKLGHCITEDVTAKKSSCTTGASYAVFVSSANLYFPSETLEPETSAVCMTELAANLRSALNSGVCFAKPGQPLPADSKASSDGK